MADFEGIFELFIFLLLLVKPSSTEDEKRVLCYYANWSEERNTAYRLLPKDIEPRLCTHIVYAFAMPDLNEGIVPMDFLETFTEGGSEEFSRLKRLNPSLKLLLSIGGWNEGSVRFSRITSDPDKRQWFAEYACQFVRGVGFDGLDVNWQWPGLREGSNSADKDNFVFFFKAIKTYFDFEARSTNRTRLLLSLVLPPLLSVAAKGFNLLELTKEADFVNLLTMEYHSATDPFVNHHSPLFGLPYKNFDRSLTVDYTVRMYYEVGIEPSKMNLGIPLYGHSYLLESSVSNSLGALAEDEGREGFGTGNPGTLAYFEICKYVKDEVWLVEHPNRTAMGPYAFKDKDWVAYDDREIVKRKVRYANQRGLGGIMLWTIDLDDFNALCEESFPLTRAAREAIVEPFELLPLPPRTNIDLARISDGPETGQLLSSGTNTVQPQSSPLSDTPANLPANNPDFVTSTLKPVQAYPTNNYVQPTQSVLTSSSVWTPPTWAIHSVYKANRDYHLKYSNIQLNRNHYLRGKAKDPPTAQG